MLLDVIKGGYGFLELALAIVSYLLLVLVMLPVHELAHAWMATKLGDDTPRWHGRLTFNPFAHLDLWGTLMLVLFGFGYAKPVPVNPRNFRNPRRDMALVALAGPLSNLLMAVLVLLLFRLLVFLMPASGTVLMIGATLVNIVAPINIGLAVFNLLPIPPLDGSRIFSAILPSRWAFWMAQHEHQIRILLIILLATGALSTPINFLASRVYQILLKVCVF
ncbi:MAG: site-2 protease family protein [Clostridia bacterium]|nr:site-2 protease family protein [Clostridia bacterium]